MNFLWGYLSGKKELSEELKSRIECLKAKGALQEAWAQQVDGYSYVVLKDKSNNGQSVAQVPNGEVVLVLDTSHGNSWEVLWENNVGFAKSENLQALQEAQRQAR